MYVCGCVCMCTCVSVYACRVSACACVCTRVRVCVCGVGCGCVRVLCICVCMCSLISPSGPPTAFKLGKRSLIPGFEEGLVGMNVGGKRICYIKPSLAYGVCVLCACVVCACVCV